MAWTFKAGADDILVTAKVSAPFVTDPAIITSPADGAHFTSIPITVEGTCPTGAGYTAAYVNIVDNGVMRGTSICDAGNNFSLASDLFPGSNSLTAHVFNSTDDEGPVSPPVNVTYDVPQPPVNNPPPAGTPAAPSPASGNPLVINTAFIYKGFKVGDEVRWPIEIRGGNAPYALSIDWGDGTSDLLSRSSAGAFDINHVYSQSGGYKNSFVIKVKATDASGNKAYLQFFVIITPGAIKQSDSILSKPTPKIGGGLHWLWFVWPLYLVVLLMAISYKLGEKEELLILRKRGLLKR